MAPRVGAGTVGVCVRSDLAARRLSKFFFLLRMGSPVSHFHMHVWFKRAQHEMEPLTRLLRLRGSAGEVKRVIADRSADPLGPLVNKSAGEISTSGACFRLQALNREGLLLWSKPLGSDCKGKMAALS